MRHQKRIMQELKHWKEQSASSLDKSEFEDTRKLLMQQEVSVTVLGRHVRSRLRSGGLATLLPIPELLTSALSLAKGGALPDACPLLLPECAGSA